MALSWRRQERKVVFCCLYDKNYNDQLAKRLKNTLSVYSQMVMHPGTKGRSYRKEVVVVVGGEFLACNDKIIMINLQNVLKILFQCILKWSCIQATKGRSYRKRDGGGGGWGNFCLQRQNYNDQLAKCLKNTLSVYSQMVMHPGTKGWSYRKEMVVVVGGEFFACKLSFHFIMFCRNFLTSIEMFFLALTPCRIFFKSICLAQCFSAFSLLQFGNGI